VKTEEKTRSFRGTLLEIVIVVGVFAVISVYILRMFLAADFLQGEAVNTSKAAVLTESVAEVWKGAASTTAEDAILTICNKSGIVRMPDYDTDTELAYGIYYNGKWEEVQSGGKFLLLVLFEKDTSTILKGTVSLYGLTLDGDNNIQFEKDYCSLDTAITLQRE